MNSPANASNTESRASERFNHVYIRMKLLVDDDWIWIKTYDWNEHGFNFFHPKQLNSKKILQFKKGVTQFQGEVVWFRNETSEKIQIEMALNHVIFESLKRKPEEEQQILLERITVVARKQDVIDEKVRLLGEVLGIIINKEALNRLIQSNQWNIVGQYGVRITDPGWSKIFGEAYERSLPLLNFVQEKREKWGVF